MEETSRNDSVSVGTTAVELLRPSANNRRKFFYIRNSSTGAQVMTLVFGDAQAITADKGIVLSPTGAYYEAVSEAFEVWQGRVWAICDIAGGTASVVER